MSTIESPNSWSDHVIVCGLHAVSLRTIELLITTGTKVVVLDDDPEPNLAPIIADWGVPLMRRGGHGGEQLVEAGLAGAAAVICAESSDLLTLETSLLVRDLRDDVRVVVHLDNPAVGRAIEDVTGEGSVLDVAGLFAPSVVVACMGHHAHDLDIGGERFVAAEVQVETAGTLRAQFGDLAPVGVIRAETEEVIVSPGRDEMLQPGDRASVIGTPEALAAAKITIDGGETDDRGAVTKLWHSADRGWRGILDHTDTALKVTLWVGLLMIVVSALTLGLFYRNEDGSHLSILEAIYFTFETGATVGFGDFSFAHQSDGMQIFGICLIVVSTVIVSLIFAFITNLLVSRRIEQSLGQGKVHEFRGHTVLIGLGSVGMRVIEGLRDQGREVAVIERDADNRYIPLARSLGVPVILGDATLGTTLDSVNMSAASSVAVMTSDDLTNIETSLTVRSRLGERWTNVPVVVRVFDRALAGRLARSFGFQHVWASASIAAPWFVGAAIGLEVLSTFYVGNEPFLVARLEVTAGGGLDGLDMLALGADLRVIALDRGDHLEYPPRRDTRFAAGDKAYLAGPYEELLHVLRHDRARA
ncbi:MAG: NAD-binding protein [Solirubrobacterales bacterium]